MITRPLPPAPSPGALGPALTLQQAYALGWEPVPLWCWDVLWRGGVPRWVVIDAAATRGTGRAAVVPAWVVAVLEAFNTTRVFYETTEDPHAGSAPPTQELVPERVVALVAALAMDAELCAMVVALLRVAGVSAAVEALSVRAPHLELGSTEPR